MGYIHVSSANIVSNRVVEGRGSMSVRRIVQCRRLTVVLQLLKLPTNHYQLRISGYSVIPCFSETTTIGNNNCQGEW